jgi:hypothetical protein
VPLSAIGFGNLPPGKGVNVGMPGLGNPGQVGGQFSSPGGGLGSNGGSSYTPATSPITHGALGPGGTSSGFGDPFGPLGPLAPLVPVINAITAIAQELTDAVTAITETISADGAAFAWAADKLISPYTEPLRIWTPEWQPLAVIAARIQDVRDYHRTLMTGCAVEWDPVPGGEYINVRSIDGMAVNDGKTYLFTFLYFGLA